MQQQPPVDARGGRSIRATPSLPRLVASSDPGNIQTLIRLLAQIAARQATVRSAV
jgi:hypothetical protein